MIPILYESNETNFNHNGICTLYGLLDYEVTEVRNGEFELELIYPVDGLWFSELTDFRIISAEPNEIDEPHRFRIYEIKKSLDEQTVIVYASTATNDLGGNLVEKVVISDEIPQQAMNKMKAALLEPTNYKFVSDIQTKSSTEWERRNPLNCIAGEAGSLIAYWGGEVKRTNDTIYLYSRRGKDNVTTIRPGKNLAGFDMTVSTKGLITAILPYFRYIPENETDYVTVYGAVVRSTLENNYPIHKITPVDFSGDESIITVEDLNVEAARYFTYTNPDCDKPKVNLEIDLMQLSDSAEYAKFKSLERIGLTDTVTVWVEKFDIDVVVKVTEVTYNGMKRMVTKLVAGTPSVKFYDDVRNTYQQDINYLKDYVDGVENGVRNQIQLTADKKNTIFRGYTEPAEGLAKLNDLWYKNLGDGNTEMFQFDGAYWTSLKITDAVFADEMSVTKFTAGTLNAALVNLINMNADNITAGTLSGTNFWVNLLTGIMRFIDPATRNTLDLDQAKITFNAGTNKERILEYTSEGLRMRPGPNNTGTNLNTSLRLHGGVTYIDFFPGDGDGDYLETDPRARVETNGKYINLKTAYGESVRVVDWAGAPRPIKVGSLTIDNATYPTYIWANHWETPRNGNRDLIMSPNGAARLKVCTPEETAYYPVWASAFVVSSSKDFKRNVKKVDTSALDTINAIEVVEYDLLGDDGKVQKGKRKDIGFIAENTLAVADEEGKMIDLYRTIALLTKALQESDAKYTALDARVSKLEKKK